MSGPEVPPHPWADLVDRGDGLAPERTAPRSVPDGHAGEGFTAEAARRRRAWLALGHFVLSLARFGLSLTRRHRQ